MDFELRGRDADNPEHGEERDDDMSGGRFHVAECGLGLTACDIGAVFFIEALVFVPLQR